MPYLIFVIGPAGCGKSTISQKIAEQMQAAYLDKDTACQTFVEMVLTLAGTDPHGRDENQYYQDHVMDVEYETILKLASDNLRLGSSVVLDAPFGRYQGNRHYLSDAKARLGWNDDVTPVVVHVDIDSQTHRRRMIDRGNPRDAWKIEHWEEYLAGLSKAECAWQGARHVHLDNSVDSPDISGLVEKLEDVQSAPSGPRA